MSKRTPDPRRLDVVAASAGGASLSGLCALSALDRLADGAVPDGADPAVDWTADFERRSELGARPQPWLHLRVAARVTRECQRCLQPVVLPLEVDRWLRFVDDEATAAALDADSEEDVLVASRQFDLQALVEDELLLAMPLVPMHATCSALPAVTPDEPPAEPEAHPFAALAALKRGTGH